MQYALRRFLSCFTIESGGRGTIDLPAAPAAPTVIARPSMETKLTAHLPTVDVEITRRKLPERNAESVTIHITAVPSLEAAARWFVQPDLFTLASPLSMFSMWSMWMRAWQPWLPSVVASVHAAQEHEKRLTGGGD
jgi:hypothetical protein